MSDKQDYLSKPIIKIFVYGTLRKDNKLGYFLEKANFLGEYYCRGQLMKSEKDNVYIDFAYNQAVTLGELYEVNFYCLQRINHLEVLSGTFPKGYDLNIMPVWRLLEEGKYVFDEKSKELAFFYRWKNSPVKILTGDYNDDIDPINEIEKIIIKNKAEISPKELLEKMQIKLSIYQSLRF